MASLVQEELVSSYMINVAIAHRINNIASMQCRNKITLEFWTESNAELHYLIQPTHTTEHW